MFPSLAGFASGASGASASKIATDAADRLTATPNSGKGSDVDWALAAELWKAQKSREAIPAPEIVDKLGKYCQEVSQMRLGHRAQAVLGTATDTLKYLKGAVVGRFARNAGSGAGASLVSGIPSSSNAVRSEYGKDKGNGTCTECGRPHGTKPPGPVQTHLTASGFGNKIPREVKALTETVTYPSRNDRFIVHGAPPAKPGLFSRLGAAASAATSAATDAVAKGAKAVGLTSKRRKRSQRKTRRRQRK